MLVRALAIIVVMTAPKRTHLRRPAAIGKENQTQATQEVYPEPSSSDSVADQVSFS